MKHFKGQLKFEMKAQNRWREFVFVHLLEHGLAHVGPEVAYCWCITARAYRRMFHMPEPSPLWYPPDTHEGLRDALQNKTLT